jgi:hypothetical protein
LDSEGVLRGPRIPYDPARGGVGLECKVPSTEAFFPGHGSRNAEPVPLRGDEREGGRMWDLDELKDRRDIVEAINWEMTPESAIETYLEWGTGWSRKDSYMSHSDQESFYFVIYDWETPLTVTLIRRDVREVDELARIQAPEELIRSAIDEGGRKPGVGVYAINAPLKSWLRKALNC